MGFADGRHGGKLEGGKSLAARQACLGEVARIAAGIAIGKLMIAKRGEIAGSPPAFAIGAVGEALPVAADAWQPQGREQAETVTSAFS